MREKIVSPHSTLMEGMREGLGNSRGFPRSKIYLITGVSLKLRIFEKSQFLKNLKFSAKFPISKWKSEKVSKRSPKVLKRSKKCFQVQPHFSKMIEI
jgi:hypothetical protein